MLLMFQHYIIVPKGRHGIKTYLNEDRAHLKEDEA